MSIRTSFLKINTNLFICDLFDNDGNFLSWEVFSQKYNLDNVMRFKWTQIKNCIPENWRRSISTDLTPFLDLCDFSPHINVKARIIKINKLSSSEIYKILITNISKPPTSQKFFNNKFDVAEKWKKVYLLPRFCTIDAYSRMFQYKILNNVLYLNDELFHLHLVDSPLCLLCNGAIENIEHLFTG